MNGAGERESIVNHFSIDLDAPSSGYVTGGDPIAGTIEIELEEHCDCRRLTVEFFWTAEGEGPSDRSVVDQIEIYSGGWTRRKRYDYDFQMRVPPGPYSFQGELFSIEWRLEAKADIYGEQFHRTSRDLRVEPGATDDFRTGGTIENVENYHYGARYDATSLEEALDSREGRIAFPLFVAGLCALGFVFLRNLFESLRRTGGTGLGFDMICFATGLLFVGLGGAVLYSLNREAAREDRIRTIDISFTPSELTPGDTGTAVLQIIAKRPVTIENIQCTCRGYERVVETDEIDRGRIDDSIRRNMRVEEHLELDEAPRQSLNEGEVAGYSFEFEIPESAPYTFYGKRNHVIWDLNNYIVLEDAPDITHCRPFTVRPKKST